MKSTGITRQVDELGRFVLPIEIRRMMGIKEKDALEIYVDGSSVILKKYNPSCIFCDNTRNVTNFKGKNICPKKTARSVRPESTAKMAQPTTMKNKA